MGDAVADLLSRATAGEQRAWDALVERFGSLLWSICRAHRLDDTDAADVFQLTWLRLLEHLGTIHDPERLAGWLSTTCRRECLSLLRRNRRSLPVDGAVFERLADAGPAADSDAVRADLDARLWRAFGRLQDRCQEILRVLMIEADEGRASYEAAARTLGMPVGSLGPTRARCLEKLGKLVAAEGISGATRDV